MSLKLRQSVRKFADFMELRLRQNEYKSGWKNDDLRALLSRLEEEVVELVIAIAEHSGNPMEIAYEAADVANFAMMIADNVKALKSNFPLTLGDIPKPSK